MLKALINTGSQLQAFSVANKIKMVNFIAIFTTFISALYTLNYVFFLDNPLVASINATFTLAYFLTIGFNHWLLIRSSKVWFFSVLMLHLFVCTNVYVTNATGFHLYYFLVPTGAFLLFELNENKEKILLSAISVLLFFFCENTYNTAPLIELTDDVNHLIYQSVILVNMVEVIVVMTFFVREIELNQAILTQQAKTDALTGIANRHCFFEQGERQLQSSTLMQRPFCILLIDVDYFKQINDKYGHAIGDYCLVELARLIKLYTNENQIFARLGGEEFVIAMNETSLLEAQSFAELLREKVEQMTLKDDNNQAFNLTVSIGVSEKQEKKDGLKELLIYADKALYHAKNKGRNRIFNYNTLPN